MYATILSAYSPEYGQLFSAYSIDAEILSAYSQNGETFLALTSTTLQEEKAMFLDSAMFGWVRTAYMLTNSHSLVRREFFLIKKRFCTLVRRKSDVLFCHSTGI
jgi:hypothetical protein